MKSFKKLLSVLLAVVAVVSLLSVSAGAAHSRYELNTTDVLLKVGESFQFKAMSGEKIELYSSDEYTDEPDVVSIGEDGYITGLRVGTAIITAVFPDYSTVECFVRVESEYGYLQVAIGDATIYYGEVVSLPYGVDFSEYSGSPDFEGAFTSSNPDVVYVDEYNMLHGVSRGEAYVTVTVTDSYGNEYSETCLVTVKFSFVQWILYLLCFGWIWM